MIHPFKPFTLFCPFHHFSPVQAVFQDHAPTSLLKPASTANKFSIPTNLRMGLIQVWWQLHTHAGAAKHPQTYTGTFAVFHSLFIYWRCGINMPTCAFGYDLIGGQRQPEWRKRKMSPCKRGTEASLKGEVRLMVKWHNIYYLIYSQSTGCLVFFPPSDWSSYTPTCKLTRAQERSSKQPSSYAERNVKVSPLWTGSLNQKHSKLDNEFWIQPKFKAW